MKRQIIILFFAVFSLCGYSQKSSIGNWAIVIGNQSLKEKLDLHYELQYRNYNAIGDLEQLLLRTGLGYNLTDDNNNILLGYGFIHSQNYISGIDEKAKVNEHRIFQQFITKQKISIVNLTHRYRFEQRILKDDFKLRFRYFLSLNIPFRKENFNENLFYLSIYNEIFINTENNFFDRNRLYGGIGYKLNEHFRFEIGYMNQFLSDKNRDQINLIANIKF